MTKEESILEEAARILRERDIQYGDSKTCFTLVARYWNDYLNYSELIKAKDVAIMMSLLKLARETNGESTRDNFVDAAGYIALAADL